MSKLEKEKLTNAWIYRTYRMYRKEKFYDDDNWPNDLLWNFCESSPELAWELIESIIETDNNEIILANLAAGPLEDLLSKHGEKFIDRLEIKLRKYPEYRRLIKFLWRNDISDPVWARLEKYIFTRENR